MGEVLAWLAIVVVATVVGHELVERWRRRRADRRFEAALARNAADAEAARQERRTRTMSPMVQELPAYYWCGKAGHPHREKFGNCPRCLQEQERERRRAKRPQVVADDSPEAVARRREEKARRLAEKAERHLAAVAEREQERRAAGMAGGGA